MSDLHDEVFEEQEEPQETSAEEPAPAKKEFIEHRGFPPYGVEFVDQHILTRAQLKEATDHEMSPKELVWKKDARGRMRIPADDMDPETVRVLTDLDEFRLVTE